METNPNELILQSLTRQRRALTQIRKWILVSTTEIEVLAFGKTKKLFSLYDLKKHYTGINIQQLRTAAIRLEENGFLELASQGVRNRPAIFWLSKKGEQLIDFYVKMIS